MAGIRLSGVGIALAAGVAGAQESVTLQGGFTPDPTILPFSAQGADPSAALVRGCPGHLAAAPAAILRLEAANAPLRLYARGAGVAALVSVGPDGVYRCAAPDGQGVAHVRYERPLSGDYAVWPASAFAGATAQGELLVSEVDIAPEEVATIAEGAASAAAATFDVAAAPAYGAFDMPPDSDLVLDVYTAPLASLSGLDFACSGDADPSRPDFVLNVGEGEAELHVTARADLDSTLAVVGPDGAVACVDDTDGVNPVVSLYDPAPGPYAVWVGAWGSAEGTVAVSVGRTAPAGSSAMEGGVALDPFMPPAWGAYALPASGPITVGLSLSGVESASAIDPVCSGVIDPTRPDLVVTLQGYEPELHVSANSAVDTTLVVLGPDGAIRCNDDFAGFNPAVAIDGAQAGDWAIWVGVWGGAEGSAEVTIDRAAPAGGASAETNPFIGRTVETAVQALDIAMAEGGLGEALSYGRLEETGPEGFVLHDVLLNDPEGRNPPLRVAQITVSELDLAGLSGGGAAERFAIRLDGVDYASLAEASKTQAGPPLPRLDPAPPMALAVSLLPPGGDETRRAFRLALELEGWLDLSAEALVAWRDGMAADGPPNPEALLADSVTVELVDRGFLGAVIDSVAEQQGRPREALLDEVRQMMTALLPAGAPGAPAEQLRAALTAKLDALDQPGVLSLQYLPQTPAALDALIEALTLDPSGAGVSGVRIGYAPLP